MTDRKTLTALVLLGASVMLALSGCSPAAPNSDGNSPAAAAVSSADLDVRVNPLIAMAVQITLSSWNEPVVAE